MSLIQSTSQSTSPRIGHSVSHSFSESTSCFSDQSSSHPFCQESHIQSASHITFQSIDQTDSQKVNTLLSLLLDSHSFSQSLSPHISQTVSVSFCPEASQSVSWSVSYSVSQSIHKFIDFQISQSIPLSVSTQTISLSDGQSLAKSANQSVSWLMSQLMNPWILIRQSVNTISQLPGYLISLTIIYYWSTIQLVRISFYSYRPVLVILTVRINGWKLGQSVSQFTCHSLDQTVSKFFSQHLVHH